MKFISASSDLKLIIEARKEIVVGRDRSLTEGLTVTFKKGVFVTSDKDLIAKLQSLPNYRRDFGPERAGTKKEKAVAPKTRAPKAPKSPVAKEAKKSAKLNKEAVKSSE